MQCSDLNFDCVSDHDISHSLWSCNAAFFNKYTKQILFNLCVMPIHIIRFGFFRRSKCKDYLISIIQSWNLLSLNKVDSGCLMIDIYNTSNCSQDQRFKMSCFQKNINSLRLKPFFNGFLNRPKLSKTRQSIQWIWCRKYNNSQETIWFPKQLTMVNWVIVLWALLSFFVKVTLSWDKYGGYRCWHLL